MPSLPTYYYLIPILQGICLLHALKTRADSRWFFAIFFAPGIGAVAYLLMEVLPALRRGNLIAIELPMFETMRVGALEKAFRFSDTVETRVALAEAYLNAGRKAEALELYKPVLLGVAKNNHYVLFGYARACYINEAFSEAESILVRSFAIPGNAKLRERWLLSAMIHEKLGKDAEAEDGYAKAVMGFNGEEARCRQALFLWAKERKAEAMAIFAKIIEHAGDSDRRYRRHEKSWIAIAKAKTREHAAAAKLAASTTSKAA